MMWINLLRSLHSISHWFLKHRGMALGVITSGSSVGGVVWPIAIRHLIIKVHTNFILCSLFSHGIYPRLGLDGHSESAGLLPYS
jgi:hypothetical protein